MDIQQITNKTRLLEKKPFVIPKNYVILQWVSLIRPAPAETPQMWKQARISG